MLPKEEDILISMPTPTCNNKIESSKMTPRPPFLSAFDYIFYLKRQVEKEKQETGNYESDEMAKENSYNTSSNGISIETPKLSELFRKLADDLRTGHVSFIDEFIDEPNNGISWLLDLLRSSLNRQQCPGMVISGGRDQPNKNKMIKNRDRQHQLKRAMTDEYDCLLCLKHAASSNPKTLNKILSHRNGLLTLASCIVSNLTKSRVIALELLAKVCSLEPDGGKKVLEAMSTMRIIFGESVRFKLLIAILNSSNGSSTNGFESTVLLFLNSLLAKSPNPAERVRLQCELEEAGFDIVSLEKRIKEKGVPPDDQIWSEIRLWRDRYINVNEVLKSNRILTRETTKLKEEVEMLSRALTKLEEDKINLMHIEREMKEKAEDLEAEVMLLRARLSESGIKITCRRRSKSTGRPGSDNSDPIGSSGAADSGRWSDSEGGGSPPSAGEEKKNFKEPSVNEDCMDDANVRNEDIFIYIPSIRPPASFTANNYKETSGRSRSELDQVKVKKAKKLGSTTSSSGSHGESRWRLRQRNDEVNEENKPTVVDLHPKKTNEVNISEIRSNGSTNGKDNSCSASMIGADCEDTEFTLDWQYPKVNKIEKVRSVGDGRPSSIDGQRRRRSQSTGYLCENEFGEVEDVRNDEIRSSEGWTQFLLKSRGSSLTSLVDAANVNGVNHRPLDPITVIGRNGHPGLDNQANGSRKSSSSSSSKTKTFTSSLQSYFFSGGGNGNGTETGNGSNNSSSSRRAKSVGRSSPKESIDSSKSFPLPNVYKKNFIAKGHSNCGLYSGITKEAKESSRHSETLSENGNVAKLLHREITLAAKELGAFY